MLQTKCQKISYANEVPYVKPMCPMSYVVQKAGRAVSSAL